MGRPRKKIDKDSLWTSANIVTLLRISGVPLFVVIILSPWPVWFGLPPEVAVWKQWIAAGVFVLLAATDGLDGYLARTHGEVTDFGKLIDPLADKILVAAALIALVELNVLPSWVVLIVLGREFIVSGIRVVVAARGVVLAASWYGKVKTVLQIIAIVLFIVKDSHMFSSFTSMTSDGLYLVSWGVMALALILTIVSMCDYFMKSKAVIMPGSDVGTEVADASERRSSTDQAPVESSAEEELPSGFYEHEELPERLYEQAQSIVHAYRERGLTLGFAESCTGGLVAATCTEVPGSSEVLQGGIVSYSNEAKYGTLGVDKETVGRFGAVSEQCACEMAQGARRALACDIAVSVTGIAGPGGGSAEKPVGTVWIGWSDEQDTHALRHCFPGSRAQVRAASVQAAFDMLLAHVRR